MGISVYTGIKTRIVNVQFFSAHTRKNAVWRHASSWAVFHGGHQLSILPPSKLKEPGSNLSTFDHRHRIPQVHYALGSRIIGLGIAKGTGLCQGTSICLSKGGSLNPIWVFAAWIR
jgi:hypothetical protein